MMPLYKPLGLILFAYLTGSIPFAYLAGKLVKGIDIRRYGSGTVSGSMIYEHTHHWLVVPVGLLDVAKAALPTYIGIQLGFGETIAATAGLAAMIGHNWPVYLKFTGGRGLSPFLGVLLVLFPWGDLWLLSFLAIGFLLKDSAPWGLASITSMPVLVCLMQGSNTIFWFIVISLVIVIVKRLEANRRLMPETRSERCRIIWLRLIFDRDMVDHNAWIHRRL